MHQNWDAHDRGFQINTMNINGKYMYITHTGN